MTQTNEEHGRHTELTRMSWADAHSIIVIDFFNPKTRAYMKTGTYRLYPKHSNTPTISEADKTILAAGDMLQKLQQAVAPPTELKLQHNRVINKLTNILNLGPQRVADTAEPRVGGQTSLTTDPTARDKVWAARPVHRRATRANPNPIKDGPLPTYGRTPE